MIIICGKTIAEVERDLEMAKQAIASGMPYGVGGATIADAEKGVEMMRSMMGGAVAPISNPNYDPCDGCPHWKPNNECEVGYDCEDEEEVEICPVCDCELDEDGYCDNCGYPDEDEDEDEVSNEDFVAWLRENDAPNYLVQLAERVLGL